MCHYLSAVIPMLMIDVYSRLITHALGGVGYLNFEDNELGQ
jgi:hypothetical protein